MRRTIGLTVLFLVLTCISVLAQDKGKNSYEIGVGVNAYGIFWTVDGAPSRDVSPGAYFEYRYNSNEHFSFGIQVGYKYGTGHSAITGDCIPKELIYNQAGLKIVAEYLMLPNIPVKPYIGIGLGKGILFTDSKTNDISYSTNAFTTVGPRIGLQIRKIRAALEFDFATKHYDMLPTKSSASLNFGYVF